MAPELLITEVRLSGLGDVPWHDRAHSLAIASRTMRRVPVDHGRANLTQKRGAGSPMVRLHDGRQEGVAPAMDAAQLIDFDHTSGGDG